MYQTIKKNRFSATVRTISTFLVITFLSTTILPPGYAQTLGLSLPIPGTMVNASQSFVPVLLKGMTVHPDNPLQFDFIIDSGHEKLAGDKLKTESERLIKYFLASMTVPQNDLWVNLSPYEKDRVVPDELGKTELGRDLLAQDYVLKQLTATLMYPEEELGKKFWERVWKKVGTQHAASSEELQSLSGDTFNKVWILPETAVVYEHENTVYITDAHLKVMLESDYLAFVGESLKPSRTQEGEIPREAINEIVREIIIPEIEREVNTGKNFATLRQIYHSLILAKWYKQTVKNSIMSQVYIDQNKTAGIELNQQGMKEEIYDRYMQAYKKGVFNYIKEDYDALSQTVIPRQYFSGGFKDEAMVVGKTDNAVKVTKVGDQHVLSVEAKPEGIAESEVQGDQAMMSNFENELADLRIPAQNYASYFNVELFEPKSPKDSLEFIVRSFGKINDAAADTDHHNADKSGIIIEGEKKAVEDYVLKLKLEEKNLTVETKEEDVGAARIILMTFEGLKYEDMVETLFGRVHPTTQVIEQTTSGEWHKDLERAIALFNQTKALKGDQIQRLKEFASNDHYWVRIAALSKLVDVADSELSLEDSGEDSAEDIELKAILKAYHAMVDKIKNESNQKGEGEGVAPADLIIWKAKRWQDDDEKQIQNKIKAIKVPVTLEHIKHIFEDLRAERVQERSDWIPVISSRQERGNAQENNKSSRYFPMARWERRYPVVENGITKIKIVKQSTQLAPYILLWQFAYDIAMFKNNFEGKSFDDVLGGLIDKENLDTLKDEVEESLNGKKFSSITPKELGEIMVRISHSRFNMSEVIKMAGLVVAKDGTILGIGYNGEPMIQGADRSVTFSDLRMDQFMLNRQVDPEVHGFYAPGLFSESESLDLRDNRPDLRRSICGEQKALLHAMLNESQKQTTQQEIIDQLKESIVYTTYDPCNQCAEYLANMVRGIRMLGKFTDPQTIRIFMKRFNATKKKVEDAITRKQLIFRGDDGINKKINTQNGVRLSIAFDLTPNNRVNDIQAFEVSLQAQKEPQKVKRSDIASMQVSFNESDPEFKNRLFNQLLPFLRKVDEPKDLAFKEIINIIIKNSSNLTAASFQDFNRQNPPTFQDVDEMLENAGVTNVKQRAYLAEEFCLAFFASHYDRITYEEKVLELFEELAGEYIEQDQNGRKKVLAELKSEIQKSSDLQSDPVINEYESLRDLLQNSTSRPATLENIPSLVNFNNSNPSRGPPKQYGDVVFLPKDANLYAIGDTHGDSLSTKAILREIINENSIPQIVWKNPDDTKEIINKFKSIENKDNIQIVFTGDYVNNGLNSLENLLLILKLKEAYPNNVILLSGNHEYRESYGTVAKEFFSTHWENASKNKRPDKVPEERKHYGHIRLELITRFGIVRGEELYKLFEDWGRSLPFVALSGKGIMMSHSLGLKKGAPGVSLKELANAKNGSDQHDIEELKRLGYEAWKKDADTLHAKMVNEREITAKLLKKFEGLGVNVFILGHTHYRSGEILEQGAVVTLASSNMYSPEAGQYMRHEFGDKIRPHYAVFTEDEDAVTAITRDNLRPVWSRQEYIRPFGKGGLKLFVQGVGTIWYARQWPVGDSSYVKPERSEVEENLRLAFERMGNEQGQVLIDTAPAYGNGEALIGDILKNNPEWMKKSFIATKWGEEAPVDESTKGDKSYSVEHLRLSMERSIARLDKVNLLYIHSAPLDTLTDPQVRQEMLKMKAEKLGGLQMIGASISKLDVLEKALRQGDLDWLDVVQIPANVFKEHGDLMDQLTQKNITIVLNRPVQSAGQGATPREEILTLANDPRVAMILNGSRHHFEENIDYLTQSDQAMLSSDLEKKNLIEDLNRIISNADSDQTNRRLSLIRQLGEIGNETDFPLLKQEAVLIEDHPALMAQLRNIRYEARQALAKITSRLDSGLYNQVKSHVNNTLISGKPAQVDFVEIKFNKGLRLSGNRRLDDNDINFISAAIEKIAALVINDNIKSIDINVNGLESGKSSYFEGTIQLVFKDEDGHILSIVSLAFLSTQKSFFDLDPIMNVESMTLHQGPLASVHYRKDGFNEDGNPNLVLTSHQALHPDGNNEISMSSALFYDLFFDEDIKKSGLGAVSKNIIGQAIKERTRQHATYSLTTTDEWEYQKNNKSAETLQLPELKLAKQEFIEPSLIDNRREKPRKVGVIYIGPGQYALDNSHLEAIAALKDDVKIIGVVNKELDNDTKSLSVLANDSPLILREKIHKFMKERLDFTDETIKNVEINVTPGPQQSDFMVVTVENDKTVEQLIKEKIENFKKENGEDAQIAIIVGTQSRFHKPYIKWALLNGYHVLADKPLTTPPWDINDERKAEQADQIVSDAQELIELSQSHSEQVAMLATQKRYTKSLYQIKKAMMDGPQVIMKYIQMMTNDGWWVDPEKLAQLVERGQSFSINGDGGKLADTGYHIFDLVPLIINDPNVIHAEVRTTFQRPEDIVAYNNLINRRGNPNDKDSTNWMKNGLVYDENLVADKFKGLMEINANIEIVFTRKDNSKILINLEMFHGGPSSNSTPVGRTKTEKLTVVHSDGSFGATRIAKFKSLNKQTEITSSSSQGIKVNLCDADADEISNSAGISENSRPAREFFETIMYAETFKNINRKVVSPLTSHTIGIKLMAAALKAGYSKSPVAFAIDTAEWNQIQHVANIQVERFSTDQAILTDSNEVGGIDMNEIHIDRGLSETVNDATGIQFEMQGMEELLNMNIQGFSPVIIDMIPINSVLPLLGLMPTEKGIKFGQEEAQQELQLSSL